LAQNIPSRENGQVTADGKSVTWRLKPQLRWSDGAPFTAADVVFTYEFINNPQSGATSSGSYETVQSVTAIDPQTVKITFKKPTSAWFLPFVGTEGMILPRHLYQAYGGERARQAPANLLPVGTGPYRVTQFKPGDVVIFEVNPYFRGVKTLGFQKVELKGGGDATSAARAVLETGDGDYAFNLQVESGILKNLEAGGKGVTIAQLGGLGERLLFNWSDPRTTTKTQPHPFFQQAQVRQAFSLAVDRGLIAQQLYGLAGQATANILLAPQNYVSPHTRSVFNLTQAAQLLEQAGWRDSNNNGIRDRQGVEMKVVFQTSVNPLRQKTQQVIKQNLQKIGVAVELKSIDPSVFFAGDPANPDTLERFNADLQMFTTGNTNPDPTKYLQTFTCREIPSPANNWSGDNYSRFCSKDYDALWQESVTTLDLQKRRQLFIQMNDLLVNNFVLLPLVHRSDVVAVGKTLQGVNLTPWDRNTWNIAQWQRQ
jgi:peptide/nickel transport system substrate-binding protein